MGVGTKRNPNFDPNVNRPPPVDYSGAVAYNAENNKAMMLAQALQGEFQFRQAGLDREMQRTANTLLGIEKLSTHLEISKLDFFKQMAAEENRHAEKMAASGALPEPKFENE
jgi:hypothetical protein